MELVVFLNRDNNKILCFSCAVNENQNPMHNNQIDPVVSDADVSCEGCGRWIEVVVSDKKSVVDIVVDNIQNNGRIRSEIRK